VLADAWGDDEPAGVAARAGPEPVDAGGEVPHAALGEGQGAGRRRLGASGKGVEQVGDVVELESDRLGVEQAIRVVHDVEQRRHHRAVEGPRRLTGLVLHHDLDVGQTNGRMDTCHRQCLLRAPDGGRQRHL
jgi:hypothetical protein